jgi:hypothetical protein
VFLPKSRTFQRGNESLARSRARPLEDERTVEETSYAHLRWLKKVYHHGEPRNLASPDVDGERARAVEDPGPQDRDRDVVRMRDDVSMNGAVLALDQPRSQR